MSRYHRHQSKSKRQTLVMAKQSKPLLVDRLTYIAAVVEPIITLPQVYQIFSQRTAAGISLSSWVGYELLTIVWLWYAVVHKEKLIFIYQGLFLIIQAGVIIGGFTYGASW